MSARERENGARRTPGPIVRALLVAVGCTAFGLAVAGAVLPILPTTPFLLLAAACFVRSSPSLHARLLATKSLGPYLRQWQEDHSVPAGAKLRAYGVVGVTFSSSIAFADASWLKLVLAGLGFGVIATLVLLRTTGGEEEDVGARPAVLRAAPGSNPPREAAG